MDLQVWITLLIAAILISLSPGAGAVTSMSYGLTHGVRNAFFAVLGLQLGWMTQFLVVGIGLGGIISASVTLFTLIKWIGVIYLIWLGVQKWRESGELKLKGVGVAFSPWRAFWQSALVNLTNPKALVFLVALLPQVLDPHRPQPLQLTLIGLTLLAVDLVVMTGYSVMASRMRRWLRNARAVMWQNRVTGTVLIGAGLLLSTARNRV